eukprot:Gb_32175 [translate_table: standard]
MDGDEIGVVLSRASELRSKINNCIQRASSQDDDDDDDDMASPTIISEPHSSDGGTTRDRNSELVKINEEQRKWGTSGDVESQGLMTIRDALASLQEQLLCLQASPHVPYLSLGFCSFPKEFLRMQEHFITMTTRCELTLLLYLASFRATIEWQEGQDIKLHKTISSTLQKPDAHADSKLIPTRATPAIFVAYIILLRGDGRIEQGSFARSIICRFGLRREWAVGCHPPLSRRLLRLQLLLLAL